MFATGLTRLAVALCLLISLTSCATTFLYNHADWLIVRQLDRYFDLSRSQTAFAYRRLDTILSRHRVEALPRYDAVLQQLAARVERGLTQEDMAWAFEQYDQLKADALGRFIADGTDFLRLINDQQVERFRKQLEARWTTENRDGPEAEAKKRADRLIAQAREWLGRLTPQQETDVARLTRQSPDVWLDRHADQRRRQEQLVDIVRQRERGDTRDRLSTWMLDPDHDSEHREVTRQFRSYLTQVILSLDRSATVEQRRYCLGKIGELMKTVQALHRA